MQSRPPPLSFALPVLSIKRCHSHIHFRRNLLQRLYLETAQAVRFNYGAVLPLYHSERRSRDARVKP